jgi:hypothetical protein
MAERKPCSCVGACKGREGLSHKYKCSRDGMAGFVGAPKDEPQPSGGQLTSEQIENWRRILFSMYGPMALLLPDDEIQIYRDMMQALVSKLTP